MVRPERPRRRVCTFETLLRPGNDQPSAPSQGPAASLRVVGGEGRLACPCETLFGRVNAQPWPPPRGPAASLRVVGGEGVLVQISAPSSTCGLGNRQRRIIVARLTPYQISVRIDSGWSGKR